ncbi:MAG: Parallel beta-helix repeat protein [Candidatus Moranbacteria bacterium GW2011_GWF2_34_56]|nr:MAG: Parallel beta-helix repeat protein [Candidatus Moranbacteria bacterium GW2011_GWF1_34_10]KKP65031.1 MAG: Parallel beta-helix repeat protein [Candidatus Moranbacteria bacterium GW2011_GWF2_34_56]HBI16940.1 hypothetical protein [Candidatus Moranbacteria bacterium]
MNIKTLLFLTFFLFVSTNVSAETYNIFVDINNSGTEDGTEANPFNTIEEAIALAKNNDAENRKIYVSNGEYAEKINLTDNIELYGENKNNAIINGDGFSTVVTMDNKTILKNIKIYKGKIGISVEKNSKVEISKVKIQKTEKIGINIEESSKKRVVTIKDCTISDNDGKGIYIKKSNYAKIYDNEIYDNEEEGIDVRSSAKGSIKSNEIYKNGEGGVELIVERSKIDINKNKIYKNSSSGIELQAYKGGLSSLSNSYITKNKLSSNKQFGIDCSTPSDLTSDKPVLWSQSVNPKGNTILDNKLGIFATRCKFIAY